MGENRSHSTNHKANNVGYSCKQGVHRMAMINTDEPVWAEQCKRSMQSVRVTGGRRAPAWCSSSHGIIVNFHIQGQTFPLIQTLHIHHTNGNIFRLLLCKLCEWQRHRSLLDYTIKYNSNRKQCTVTEHWSSNNALFPPANPILTAYCAWIVVHPWLNLMETCNNVGMPEIMQSDIATSSFVFRISLWI